MFELVIWPQEVTLIRWTQPSVRSAFGNVFVNIWPRALPWSRGCRRCPPPCSPPALPPPALRLYASPCTTVVFLWISFSWCHSLLELRTSPWWLAMYVPSSTQIVKGSSMLSRSSPRSILLSPLSNVQHFRGCCLWKNFKSSIPWPATGRCT